ncbi:hypothetical protein INS49_004233 [Diaporthe citri]|uniref:uncharacterized protein n=1 Tax=Diaporthe citri TaxID=83186 RepID=UPI001C80B5BA|nr:uncharacterized protein INS49_004233 [Diaporthe citri]KAG6355152.1 hypothetical protein INS49_004233 [Diaporthe citri]
MPAAGQKRKRAGAVDRANNNASSSHSENNHQSAQPAVPEASKNASPGLGSEPPRDGARNPVAPDTEYTSLRRITRRLPDEPGHLLDGVDITSADLSWTAREEGDDINPKTGEPWLYPKRRRGKGEGSNLEDFREDIQERTKNGQGCKAISEILIAKGVDTSVRAVARQRMKWGLRQRAPRRMTEQGIANIRKAHLEQAKRMANSDPVPVKRVRIRVMRKAEILRMTKEGMSTAQIAENLQSRGVKLKRGAATVERLRTIWGLVPDSERNVNNIRQFHRNQALKLQREQFENIATELGIEDVKAWVKSKMDEEGALEARREYGYRLMGHLRPRPVEPETMRAIVNHWKANKASNKAQEHGAGSEGIETPDQLATSTEPETPTAQGAAYDPIELSDDDDELDSEEDEDCEGDEDQEPPAEDVKAQLSRLGVETDHSESRRSQTNSTNGSCHPTLEPTSMEIDRAFDNSHRNQAALPDPPIRNAITDPNVPGGLVYPQYWTGTNMQETQPGPEGIGQHPPVRQKNAAPVASAPFEPPSQGWIELRTLGPSTGHRRIAPKPGAPGPIIRPFVPRLPPVITPPGEAEMMAKYGLYPFATFRREPQKYLTPSGLITTEGYEYLPSAPGFPGIPGSMQQQQQQHQTPSQGALMPLNSTAPHQPPGAHQLPPDVIMVQPPAPPRPSNVPAPPLVIPPEEAERHRASYDAIEKHHKAALECMEYLAARADARPLRESLTGMPPSLKDVENAKGRLREAAEAMLVSL